jgi:hypothetical protein
MAERFSSFPQRDSAPGIYRPFVKLSRLLDQILFVLWQPDHNDGILSLFFFHFIPSPVIGSTGRDGIIWRIERIEWLWYCDI